MLGNSFASRGSNNQNPPWMERIKKSSASVALGSSIMQAVGSVIVLEEELGVLVKVPRCVFGIVLDVDAIDLIYMISWHRRRVASARFRLLEAVRNTYSQTGQKQFVGVNRPKAKQSPYLLAWGRGERALSCSRSQYPLWEVIPQKQRGPTIHVLLDLEGLNSRLVIGYQAAS